MIYEKLDSPQVTGINGNFNNRDPAQRFEQAGPQSIWPWSVRAYRMLALVST
ncbi:MAG: hypothetical protein WBD56_03655 [Anaerolineales bacterium]